MFSNSPLLYCWQGLQRSGKRSQGVACGLQGLHPASL